MIPAFESTAILGAPVWAPPRPGLLGRTMRAAIDAVAAAGGWGERRRARAMGWIDDASGLYNARGFAQAGEEVLAQSRRAGKAASVVVLEFDDLLEVRSIYGREAAQEALARMVGRLQDVAGHKGIAARTGRTQFAVLIPGANRERAEAIVRRVLGKPARVEFEAGGEEVVLVPDIQCEAAAPACESAEELYRDIAAVLAEQRAREKRRQLYLQRERERHSRPMSIPASTF